MKFFFPHSLSSVFYLQSELLIQAHLTRETSDLSPNLQRDLKRVLELAPRLLEELMKVPYFLIVSVLFYLFFLLLDLVIRCCYVLYFHLKLYLDNLFKHVLEIIDDYLSGYVLEVMPE